MAETNHSERRLFLGCFIALVATAFGFAVRGAVLSDWALQFGLSEEQKGILNGVGLAPFAISIILLSLVIDRIGYGWIMAVAFTGHFASSLLTIFAPNYQTLYIATFIFGLANGAVEAVINPVVATIYRNNKTHWLNVLHAGWPGGLVLGGLLSIAVFFGGTQLGDKLPGHLWQWQMGLLLPPIIAYGLLLLGQNFPQQERVEAGVSYRSMLEEFGWASAYIVSFLILMGISQFVSIFAEPGSAPLLTPKAGLVWAIAPAVLFGVFIHSFGRPMFVFLLVVMMLLATTELGTDGWIQDIMGSTLRDPVKGTMFLVYTSAIMFVLRFFAGPIVHRISPLGLLAVCAALATVGLYWLGHAGEAVFMLILAATVYAFGKTFFWPTTLGVVSEQYPKGGALLLNAISGVGMIFAGTIGSPAIGTVQDRNLAAAVEQALPETYPELATTTKGQFFDFQTIDKAKIAALPEATRTQVEGIQRETKQLALADIAVLPAIMCVCYLGLIMYFKSRGGYKAQVLAGHSADDGKFTGGVAGAMEA
ncbi:MAG: MFS transporter [Planctomycetaceae bacterium]|nr:MFS transporter [Planctomycetaceae bacterium]